MLGAGVAAATRHRSVVCPSGGGRRSSAFQGNQVPPAMTQAQAKCSTGSEAGGENSGPQARFLEREHLYWALRNWKGVTRGKPLFMTSQVLQETRTTERKTNPHCHNLHMPTHIEILPSLPALGREMMRKATTGRVTACLRPVLEPPVVPGASHY